MTRSAAAGRRRATHPVAIARREPHERPDHGRAVRHFCAARCDSREDLAALRRRFLTQPTAGVLVTCHQSVYRDATSTETFESRCAAACVADASAVISGPTAAELCKFCHVRRPDHPIVIVAHDRNPLARGVVLRRTNVLTDEDRVVREDGIVVASPPRTWFTMRRSRHCGARCDDSRRSNGLAVPELLRQHALRLPYGVVIHADGADLDLRWAVEIDHVTSHGGRADSQRDKGRNRGPRRIGWHVDRVTDHDLREDFDATIAELVDLRQIRRTELVA